MSETALSAVYKIQSVHRVPDLIRSVHRMKRQPGPEIETVVLTDSTGVHVELKSVDSIDLLAEIDDPRLTAARNAGADYATGKAVAFVDDDAYPGEDWADHIRAGLGQANAAGGPLHPEWRVPQPSWLPEPFYWLIGCGPFYDELRIVPNTYGSNFVVDREAFMDVGGFDTDIGAGSDSVQQGAETDLARRLRETGYTAVWYDPEAVVYHVIECRNVHRAALLRRAYEQGVAKAKIGFDDRERGYLREEWSLGENARQAAASLAFTAAVGTGFVRGQVVG